MKKILLLSTILCTNFLFAQDIPLNSGSALLGNSGTTSTQLIYWNGTNAYYGRRPTGMISVNNHYFRTDGQTRLTINNAGNIGIGTTTPAAKLDVEGGDLYVGEEASVNGTRRELRVYGYDSNQKFYGSLHSNYDDSKRTFDISSSYYTHQLKIDASANVNGMIAILPGENVGVGIGTLTTGTHKLAVEGTIGAREIKVEASGWSDFVFYDNYELLTLEEVEEHIAKNGHLPEIPSEAEVNENGINLGEMNAKLLQKIEEITLYLIEQNKQNQIQQVRIEKLEKQLKALKDK